MAYNPYDAVKMITDYKVGWHTADTNAKNAEKSGDIAKSKEYIAEKTSYAKKAQPFYQQLRENGYTDVADALQNTNDIGAKYILDTYKKNTIPESSVPEAKDITTADGMITDIYGIQRTNMGDMKKKYDYLEDYNYNFNPYESDEGKAILSRYQYQGKTASENAAASGGASNGGNIDSYAAANANRQQLAYTVAGDQAIQEYRNNLIHTARGILNDMGTYLQNQEKGMQTTINQKQTEEQRTFENDETSKNNDVNRKVTISEVTGHVPNEWALSNNYYLNDDGTLKDEYKDVDFSAVMAKAKATGNTNAYNEAATARYVKIMSDYANYGKYDDGNYTVPGLRRTESGRRFEKEIEATKELSANELASQEKRTQAEIEADIKKNNADNATKLQITDKELSANSQSEEVTFDDFKANIKIPTADYGSWTFVNKVIKEYWNNGADVVFESTDFDESGKVIKYPEGKLPLKTLLLDNAKKYGITADGAKAISSVFGFSPTWVDNYDVWYDTKAKKDEEPEYKPEDVK